MALGSGQSCFDQYDFSSNHDEYLMPENVAEIPPGLSDHAARILTTTRLNLNLPPESPKNWEQVDSNSNDYHSDPLDISSSLWLPEITDWWQHQEETHTTYTDLSDVARDIFSIIPQGVGVEASFSFGRDVIGWRRSNTTGESLRKKSRCKAVCSSQW